jgi:nucleoside-diphosphate-sugar epimerase
MRVLVTGGLGYIGSILVPELLKKDYTVTVLDNLMWGKMGLNANLGNQHLKVVEGDVRDAGLISKLVPQQDVIVHLAALVGIGLCEANKEKAVDVNVNGTRNITNHLSDNQLFVFASTGSIYGKADGLKCNEWTTPNPLSNYAKTKMEAEKIVSNQKNSIVLRFGTAFGVSGRMRLDLLVNQFVYEAVTKGKLTVFGEDFNRSLIHVNDVSNSIIFAIENQDAMKGQTYNVSLKQTFTKKEIAAHIKRQIDYDLQIEKANSDFDYRNYSFSTEKIMALGYSANLSLDQGIAELVRAMKELKVDKNCFNT